MLLKRYRTLLTYLAFAVVPAFAVVLVVRMEEGRLGAGTAGQGATSGVTLVAPPEVYKLLLAVAVIVAAAYGAGSLFKRLGQPRVVGEIVLGILLGPSALGLLFPQLEHWLFTPSIASSLDMLAQFGVIFFMFLTGLELPIARLRGSGPMAVVLGHACIAAPMLLGVVLASTLSSRYRPQHIGAVPFMLFCGLALSITAFPVLARILVERGLAKHRLGVLGLTTAGIGDVTAWCLLAVVVASVRSQSLSGSLFIVLWTVLFGLFVQFVVRAPLARLLRSLAAAGRREAVMIVVVTTVLVSALATERIGVHPIFGAFIAGLIMPRDAIMVHEVAHRIQGFTGWVMLPLFFATVGLKTHIGGLGGAAGWGVCGLIVAVAIFGKFFGTAVPARLLGNDWRSSLGLAAMMNCRGLTELVVLNLGLSLGVILPDLFAMLVVMTVVTTMLTGPLLNRLGIAGIRDEPGEEQAVEAVSAPGRA
ncbi:sodium:proton exchanger [Solihabitans fulvus]|uniref:Sodium:proton exchanger n=1 Tax=Solihabitans fulvus TaxID=1892852 RepID=A0A5B2WJS4_9PSEU|nr:cation:proton antiporter [Solihabitans fulvus]KAA2250942.1 sodium:proton exchanger [Solihabitans fulvus]